MVWHAFYRKPKLARDYEEERRQVEALRETQRKNLEWKALETEKANLKKALRKKDHTKALAILNRIEKAGIKDLRYIGRKSRPYVHRYLKKKKSVLARYV